MKKRIVLLAFLSFACSKKEEARTVAVTVEEPSQTQHPSLPKPIIGSSDPILSERIAGNEFVDEVKIYEIKTVFGKDSVRELFYRIHFLKNSEIVHEYKDKETVDNGSEWGIWNTLMQRENDTVNIDRRFIQISNGFPACGYAHLNMLFFAGENGIQKVTENYAMADGEFGSYTQYLPTIVNGKAVKFSSVSIARDASEKSTPEREVILVNYSDSTDYEWKNGKWEAQRRTPKEKVYRQIHEPLLHGS